MINKERIADIYKTIQQEITDGLESLDGQAKFEEELWERPGGGGGRTRIIQNGALIEKGGVNFSAVHGPLPEAVQKAFGVEPQDFFATGVSIVLHPNNPNVPIIHMNIRYFELSSGKYWFGGGIDLTPHYIVREKARKFHRGLKEVCDKYDDGFYAKFKKWADDYFFIPHRNETRGIGGVFYDRLHEESTALTKEELFNFSVDLGRSFVPLYTEQVQDARDLSFSENEKNWQLLRRGRYVEFNLVYDAGTKFGLQTNGRIESILMSLPQNAGWFYDYKPVKGSLEEDTLGLLKKDVDWLSL